LASNGPVGPQSRRLDALSGVHGKVAVTAARHLHSEYRESQDQEHEEDHDEDIEQNTRYVGGSRRDIGEAENAGNDRNQEEEQRPPQECHSTSSSRIKASTMSLRKLRAVMQTRMARESFLSERYRVSPILASGLFARLTQFALQRNGSKPDGSIR